MKITLGQLERSVGSLEKLLKNKLPLLVAYRIGKYAKQSRENLQIYYEKRNKLLAELGKERLDKDGKPELQNGNTVYDLGENMDKFNEEVKKVYNEELEIEVNKTTLKELEGYDLEPAIFVDLDFLFTE